MLKCRDCRRPNCGRMRRLANPVMSFAHASFVRAKYKGNALDAAMRILDQSETNALCRLAADDQAMLENAIDLLQLSARSMHRILRVAQTIADLAGSADILGPHVVEAIGYRRGERAVMARVA